MVARAQADQGGLRVATQSSHAISAVHTSGPAGPYVDNPNWSRLRRLYDQLVRIGTPSPIHRPIKPGT